MITYVKGETDILSNFYPNPLEFDSYIFERLWCMGLFQRINTKDVLCQNRKWLTEDDQEGDQYCNSKKVKLIGTDTERLTFGTDKETALVNAVTTEFPAS